MRSGMKGAAARRGPAGGGVLGRGWSSPGTSGCICARSVLDKKSHPGRERRDALGWKRERAGRKGDGGTFLRAATQSAQVASAHFSTSAERTAPLVSDLLPQERQAPPVSLPTRRPLRTAMDDTFANDTPDYTNFTDEWSADGRETVHFIIRCVIPSVYLLIITVGLLGNITLVKIFITTSAMRSVPNIFISSLAVGDLLLLVTCVPVDAFRYFFEEWIFGTVACKLIPVIQLTSVGVSVFTLTALSADRHKAIVNPMDIQTSSAVFWTCLKAISIWVVSVILAVPEAIFSQVVHMSDRNVTFTACVPYPLSNEMHPKIHSVMIFLVYFLIPLGIISVYYYHIARTLIKSAHDMPGEVSEHSKRQVRPSLI
ncbi:hypothetical protein AOLI_G00028640 [Acnodon oligacanthus]